MEAICTTNTVVEPTEQTPELPYVNNTELIKLQESFDDALVYSAWYGVAMPTVAAVGVVLNAMAFRLVDFLLRMRSTCKIINVQRKDKAFVA